jgi:hypothetical protein
MKRLLTPFILLLAVAALPAPTLAADTPEEYRLEEASVSLSETQAGAHPDFTTSFRLSENEEAQPYALTRDIVVELPPGMVGNPEAFPKCTSLQLGTSPPASDCPLDSQVGVADIELAGMGMINDSPIFSMPALGGNVVARFGFFAGTTTAIVNVRLNPETNTLVAGVEGASTAASLIGASTTFWGVPADESHDLERLTPDEAFHSKGPPPGGRRSSLPEIPFMANPTSCEPGQTVSITARSYARPDLPSTKVVPFPQITGCGSVEFKPTTAVAMTTSQGTSGSGLDYQLDLPTTGFAVPNLYVGSHLKRAEVILPEGVTINPSQAEGIGVCSPADYARETYNSAPNVGCPETSKIGSVEAITPVIDRNPSGSLYLAKPYENPFGSLLALYMVMKVPDRGVLVKLAGKVTLDPQTGQITTVFDDGPQLPFASFRLHFREGARSPLVTPAACGSYTAISNFTPWSAPGSTIQKTNSLNVSSGPDRGPCPSGGLPPFKPGLLAGTLNNAAGTHSPFNVRLTRTDDEQEITHFSIKLPPGLLGKLAGIPFCPEAAIAAAKARTGDHGGAEELAAPSCPPASEIGRTLVGAGVGQVLVYVPGKVYLAGPYNGSALSIVAVTAAKAGPFDLGTVVVRYALRVNPDTAEVFVDATGSDPIPHIIQGVPVRLRDIRAYVDRPNFVLNPTSCKRTSTASTVRGAGLDFTSEADNNPVTVTSPFQAADCGALGFKPRLKINLKGGTKRNANPALTAVVRARPGDANIAAADVTLPHSAFLDQSHIKTVCTRVQFNSGPGNGANCPAGSIYGKAKAVTPLLDEPLSGPVFLRSSSHPLPDMVVALHSGKIDVNLVGRIDTGKGGGIRSSFESVPDAPVTTFTLQMFGGKKGLIVNSTNLCRSKNRAVAEFSGQNGKQHDFRPVVKPKCAKKARGKGKAKRKSNRGR